MADASKNVGYMIWGVDNIVYGPVELPTLVTWVKQERILKDTWVFSQRENSWKKASDFDEFQMFFRPKSEGGSQESSQAGKGISGIRPGMLRRVKIFAGMTDDQLTRFVEFMEVRQVDQFREVVRQGQPGDGMYLLLEGEVRARLMIDERETTLATLAAGDFFGEISLFDHGPRSADVVANNNSTLLKISAGAFQRLSNEAPELATPFLLGILKTLTTRMRSDNKRYRDSIVFSRSGG